MKKIFLLSILVLCMTLGLLPQTPAYAFADRPATFIVLDNSGNATRAVYRSWNQMVKMNYHFPDYKLTEDNSAAVATVQQLLYENGGKVNAAVMAQMAKDIKAEALVLVRVYDMRSYTVHGSPFHFEAGELYTRTIAYADLHAYNVNGDKYAQKKVRENDLTDMGNAEAPEDIIKWKLGNMLNKMEGRAPLE